MTCNNKLAEIARNYVKRGTKILVEGFPSVNAYISRENKPMGTLRIYANNIELLSKKDSEETLDPITSSSENYTLPENDIPF